MRTQVLVSYLELAFNIYSAISLAIDNPLQKISNHNILEVRRENNENKIINNVLARVSVEFQEVVVL